MRYLSLEIWKIISPGLKRQKEFMFGPAQLFDPGLEGKHDISSFFFGTTEVKGLYL